MIFLPCRAAFLSGLLSVWACHGTLCLAADSTPAPGDAAACSISPEDPGGIQKVIEAAIRAGHMRDIGNHVHFCRWRQTERLVELLASDEVVGTVH